MKLRVYICLFMILICAITSLAPATAEENIIDEIEGEVDEQLNELDLSEFERFVSDLDDGIFGDIRSTIQGFIRGEEVFSLNDIFAVITDKIINEVVFSIPICASIILICVLSSTLSKFSSEISGKATENIVHFVCFAAILVILTSSIVSISKEIAYVIEQIGELINIIFPIMITLVIVVGGNATASMFSPYITILSTLIINGLNSIILPLYFASFILSAVNSLSDGIKLDGIRKFIITFCNWLLGLGFGVFCTFLGGQSIVSGSFDNISVKATKFALSSYVPILGGYLSDGFDIVIAGSLLIKNAVGITSVFILFLLILLPLIKLVIFMLALKLTSGIVQTISEKKISDMLSAVSSTVSILISLLLGTAFVFFFVVVLLVYTVNAGVI